VAQSDYVTLQEVKASAELTGMSFADNDLRAAIPSAARGIEEYCDRRFWLDDDATSVRYYSPVDNYCVQIDDLVTLGTFQTDYDGDGTFETSWAVNTDFVLDPLNASADGKPYEEVRLHPHSSLRFPCWPRSVKITGQFGWPTVPAPIKQATTIMAVRLMMRARQAPFGVIGIGADNVAVRISKTDPDVAFLIDPYVRGSGVMLA